MWCPRALEFPLQWLQSDSLVGKSHVCQYGTLRNERDPGEEGLHWTDPRKEEPNKNL